MTLIQVLRVIALGMIEGITEWLPVSSTGHLLLLENVLSINATEEFKSMFFVVIQLGAILSVVILYWSRLWPLTKEKGRLIIKTDTLRLWLKTIIAIIPSGIVGVLFDEWMEDHLHTPPVIALTLIIYGILFILIERHNRGRRAITESTDDITYRLALCIGFFQILSLVPGTSRSGATIMGALLLGLDRTTASEFTFFMGIPTMLGASLIKILKFGFSFTRNELIILTLGTATAFLVSLLVIKFLMSYIKKHDFTLFGIYRIILGALILLQLAIGKN